MEVSFCAFATAVVARVRGLSGWRRYAVAFAAGALASAALPPFYILPLAFLSFPLLIWLLDGCRGNRAAFASGWWFGFGSFVAGLYWIGNAFLVEGDSFAWAMPLGVVILPAYLALYSGLAAWVSRRFLWLKGAGRVVIFALCWTLAEWLRGHLFGGFPWNLAGYVWTFSDALIQPAALFGAYGLSLLSTLVFVLPAAARPGGGWRKVAFWRPFASIIAIVGAMALFGGLRLAGASDAVVPDVRLRIVQANIPQNQKWRRETQSPNFVRYLTMSESFGYHRITHIIWPEAAVTYFLDTEPARSMIIGKLAGSKRIVITGAPRVRRGKTAGDLKVWNSLHAINGRGEIVATYDKNHLVPFGEYLPFRPLLEKLGLDKLAAGDIDYSPGTGIHSLTIPGTPPVGPLICYEAIFPGAVVDRQNRPGWLLNITNDGWYGDSTGPYQHLQMTRMRAVEEGLPMVRAAGTGISAVFDAWGRQRHSLALSHRGLIDSDLPVALATPGPYGRFGDLTFFALILALVIVISCAIRYRNMAISTLP